MTQFYYNSINIEIGDGDMAERKDRVNVINGSDNGGRRKNEDRRQFTYTIHIPERRNGSDRRKSVDRRHHGRLDHHE